MFLCIGSYDKWFCIKTWRKFSNLLIMCKAPCKIQLSERCLKHSSPLIRVYRNTGKQPKYRKATEIPEIHTYIIGFLINVQGQGQYPHQWAPFQIAGLLHALQISHKISRYVYHEGWLQRAYILCNPSLSAASMSSWASQAHAFPQPVCEKLSLLHHWSVRHVHTSGAFSPSEWGPDPQCQAAQVADWTWWWQCLAAWHCRSVWSLPCHFVADAGGLALSMAKSHWREALRFAHKSCTHGHVSWKRGGVKRELVADPWTSSRRFSHVLWLKVHSHRKAHENTKNPKSTL